MHSAACPIPLNEILFYNICNIKFYKKVIGAHVIAVMDPNNLINYDIECLRPATLMLNN